MGMEFWLIPLIVVVVIGLGIFYLVIKRSGGSGIRDDGHTMMDKPGSEDQPKSDWNYYRK
jgi:hypothetical protein